ncbi:MAG TPA: hypothetical protein VEY10_20615 [Flavisolibacter sp.]|nr:hypothetical protein [Flavisolibacter sp.]
MMYSSEANSSQRGMVKVKLIKDTAVVVNGNITGRMYVFRTTNDINWVDKRDAISMKEADGLQVFY